MPKLKIKLISDMCVSSGENYSAVIDNDVCYDKYGFPFIPAKRIKGCLREVATQLCDWDIISKTSLDDIFGKAGGSSGKLIIYDAKLLDYERLMVELQVLQTKKDLKGYLHFQNILDNYTYTRAQTSIENNIAKENSLRYTRVVKRGTNFILEYILPDIKTYNDVFEKCFSGLKSIGIHKTRGFGRIEIERYSDNMDSNNCKLNEFEFKNIKDNERYKLEYTILLKSNMLFPIRGSNYMSTENYIPGSSIRGYLSNKYIKNCQNNLDNFNSLFIDNNLIYQNAYISFNNNRLLPIPNSIYQFKDEQIQAKGCESCFDRLIEKKIDKPISRLKSKYVYNYPNKTLNYADVETEINVHNSVNKNTENYNLYNFSSICSGQTFKGYIIGLGKYLKLLKPIISDTSIITLGKSITSQYGKGTIKYEEPKIIKLDAPQYCKRFVCLLNSPTLILNKDLYFSSEIEDIKHEIENTINYILKNKKCTLEIDKSFISYKVIGGYNTKWNLPKSQIIAFDAGSVLVFNSNVDVNISNLKDINIGYNTIEGYGEVSFYSYNSINSEMKLNNLVDNMEYLEYCDLNKNIPKSTDLGDYKIIVPILKREIKNKIEMFAIERATKNEMPNSTVVGKLILINKKEKRLKQFINILKNIKDKEKKNKIFTSLFNSEEDREIENFLSNILLEDKNIMKTLGCLKLEPNTVLNIDEIYNIYTEAYLVQSKYRIKQNKERE